MPPVTGSDLCPTCPESREVAMSKDTTHHDLDLTSRQGQGHAATASSPRASNQRQMHCQRVGESVSHHHHHHHNHHHHHHHHHHELQQDGRRQQDHHCPQRHWAAVSKRSSLKELVGHSWLVLVICVVSLLRGCAAEMTFTVQPSNQSVALGQTVVLRCTVVNLIGNVQWFKNGFGMGIERPLPSYERHSMIGEESRGEYNLQIQEVTVEDEGRYECQVTISASYPNGMRGQIAYLAVVVPPQRPRILQGPKVAVKLHTPTEIHCRADRGKPAAQITWHLDGLRLRQGVTTQKEPSGSYFDTISVLRLNATRADAGKTLECMAKTEYMSGLPLRTSSVLDVLYPPDIEMTVNITSRSIRENDNVRIQCLGTGNPNRIIWSWQRNGTDEAGASTNTFHLPAIAYDWHGNTVTCIANNTAGSSRRSMVLNVEYGAKITDITEVVGADVGSPALLECTAKGNPAPHVVWKRGDTGTAKVQPTLSTNNVYRIKHVRDGSYGRYLCIASVPGFPVSSREARLVKNMPPIMISRNQQTAVAGDNAHIDCLTDSIPKPSSYMWSRNGEAIDYARSGRLSVEEVDRTFGRKYMLHFQPVKAADFGVYNCTVVNAYGKASEQIELVEKHVLPITFIIIGIFGSVALIILIVVVCCLYKKRHKEEPGSVLGETGHHYCSYTDTESSSDKKRDKADSPTTLMGQLRQDYNKDIYRFSADYDDMPYKEQGKGNNNGYGVIGSYEAYSDQPVYDGDYVPGQRGEDLMPDRFDNVYNSGTGYSFSSFNRGNNFDSTTPPPTMPRLTPLHVTDSKLATDV